MGIFQDITLSWNGEDFVIPANRVLGAIAIVEEQVNFAELLIALERNRPPLLALAKAFGGVLRYAGARVTDEETYAGMFQGNMQEQAVNAINTLLVMMIPPEALAVQEQGDGSPGKSRAAKARPSKRSTKRASATAG